MTLHTLSAHGFFNMRMEIRGSRREPVDVSFSYQKDKTDTDILKASHFSNNILPYKYYNDMVKGDVKKVVQATTVKEKVTMEYLPYGRYHAGRNDPKFLKACLKPGLQPFSSIEDAVIRAQKRLWSAALVRFVFCVFLFVFWFVLSLFSSFFVKISIYYNYYLVRVISGKPN